MEQSKKIRNHRDLDLWKLSMNFVKEIYQVSEKFPGAEKYGLTAQIRRATISICSNIAEGAGRKHTKEFIQFLNISQGSVSEVETHLEVALTLNYVQSIEAQMNTLKRIRIMICRLIQALEK